MLHSLATGPYDILFKSQKIGELTVVVGDMQRHLVWNSSSMFRRSATASYDVLFIFKKKMVN